MSVSNSEILQCAKNPDVTRHCSLGQVCSQWTLTCGEGPDYYGKVKDAPPQGAKPLTWLGSLRGAGRLAVPLAGERPDFSNLFPALPIETPHGGHA